MTREELLADLARQAAAMAASPELQASLDDHPLTAAALAEDCRSAGALRPGEDLTAVRHGRKGPTRAVSDRFISERLEQFRRMCQRDGTGIWFGDGTASTVQDALRRGFFAEWFGEAAVQPARARMEQLYG